MRTTLTIEATEPRTMRELLNQAEQFRAAANLVTAQNQSQGKDDPAKPYFDRISALEKLAPEMPLRTLGDCVDAFDFYDALIDPGDAIYSDHRDYLLLQSIRGTIFRLSRQEGATDGQRAKVAAKIANLEHGGDRTQEQGANLPLGIAESAAPISNAAAEPISPVEVADRLNEVRHSLALVLELAEARAHRSQSDLERAAVNGLVDLLYQQNDRLEALRDRVHPESVESD